LFKIKNEKKERKAFAILPKAMLSQARSQTAERTNYQALNLSAKDWGIVTADMLT